MTTPVLFDRKLLLARRGRAIALGAETFLLERVTEELVERLAAVKRRFPFALDFGTPGDALVKAIAATGQVDRMVTNDSSAYAHMGSMPQIVSDEEALPFGEAKFDLAVSALALQWVNDLPGTLLQIRRALKPDGLLLAALIGGETLHELRESFAAAEAELTDGASPRVSPFVEVRSLGSLLQQARFSAAHIEVVRRPAQ